MDAVSYFNGYREEYFEKDVSSKFTPFLLINGFSAIVIISIFAPFLNVPSQWKLFSLVEKFRK